MKDRRLMPLVDDTHRDEEHAGPHIERPTDEEVDIRLLELKLAHGLARHDRVLELELGDEADPVGEVVGEQQDEAVEVQHPVFVLPLVVVEIHVARDRARRDLGRRVV